MDDTTVGSIAPTVEYRTLPDSQNFISTEACFKKLLINEQLLAADCKDVNEKQYKIIDIVHKTTVGTSTTIATPAGLFRSAGKVQATTSIPGRTSWTDFNRP